MDILYEFRQTETVNKVVMNDFYLAVGARPLAWPPLPPRVALAFQQFRPLPAPPHPLAQPRPLPPSAALPHTPATQRVSQVCDHP